MKQFVPLFILSATVLFAQPDAAAFVLDVGERSLLYETNSAYLITNVVNVGSLIKPYTLVAADRAGIDLSRVSVNCKPSIAGTPLAERCWTTDGHGHMNTTDALAHSCNYFFLSLSERIPRTVFITTLHDYGLEGDADALRNEEMRILGTGLNYASFYSLPALAFGLAAMLGDGTLYAFNGTNHIIRKGHVAVPAKVRKIVRKGMALCAKKGTGKEAASALPSYYTVAMKTGTSAYTDSNGVQKPWRTHAMCLLFYPEQDPAFMIVVFIRRGWGGREAARMAITLLKEKVLLID